MQKALSVTSTQTTGVQFLIPGKGLPFNHPDMWTLVEARDTSLVNCPTGTLGFRFFDAIVKDGEIVNRSNPSGLFYLEGKIISLEEATKTYPDGVERLLPEEKVYGKVIITNKGAVLAFRPQDTLLAS